VAAVLLALALQQLQAREATARLALVVKVAVVVALVVAFPVLAVLAGLVVSQQPVAVAVVDQPTGQILALVVLAVLVLFAFIAGRKA
jgi:hypothetical protein